MNKVKSNSLTYPWLMLLTLVLVAWSPFVLAQNSCAGNSGRAAKIVQIEVDDSGNPFFSDHACASRGNNAKKGDICSAKNEKPVLKFKLEGSNARDWELVRLELSENGTSWPGNLPAGAVSDFEFDSTAGLNAGTPFVKLSWSKKTMEVKNNNCHDFEVHYQVVLKDPAGDEQKLHPVIENKGTN